MEIKSKGLDRLFKPVVSRDDAVQLIGEAARACYVIAAIQALVSLVFGPWGLVDAVLYAGLGIWLQRGQSRVAAVLLLIVAVAGLATTVMNRVGAGSGGRNILLAAIVAFVGYRACQATFKLASMPTTERA